MEIIQISIDCLNLLLLIQKDAEIQNADIVTDTGKAVST